MKPTGKERFYVLIFAPNPEESAELVRGNIQEISLALRGSPSFTFLYPWDEARCRREAKGRCPGDEQERAEEFENLKERCCPQILRRLARDEVWSDVLLQLLQVVFAHRRPCLSWAELYRAFPDLVRVLPCGFVEEALSEARAEEPVAADDDGEEEEGEEEEVEDKPSDDELIAQKLEQSALPLLIELKRLLLLCSALGARGKKSASPKRKKRK